MDHYILTHFLIKCKSRAGASACELTVNCMSLSLLVVDLGKKGLVAGKQTNHKVNTTAQQENVCVLSNTK